MVSRSSVGTNCLLKKFGFLGSQRSPLGVTVNPTNVALTRSLLKKMYGWGLHVHDMIQLNNPSGTCILHMWCCKSINYTSWKHTLVHMGLYYKIPQHLCSHWFLGTICSLSISSSSSPSVSVSKETSPLREDVAKSWKVINKRQPMHLDMAHKC